LPEPLGDGVVDQRAVRDDEHESFTLAAGVHHAKEVVARERLAAGQGHVIELDLAEHAIEQRQQLGARQRTDAASVVRAPVVVAVAAALVAVARELDREGVAAGTSHGRSMA
jgi:hypothetical protein